MKPIKEAMLSEYRDVIRFIKSVADESVTEEKIATRLGTMLRMSRTRSKKSGKTPILSPKETNLYKMAVILKDAKTYEDFLERASKAIKKRKAEELLPEGFGILWNPSFDMPDNNSQPKPSQPPNPTPPSKGFADRVKELEKRVETLEELYGQAAGMYEELAERLAVLERLMKVHTHNGAGVACVPMEERY